MTRPIQKRAVKTRANLIAAAQQVIRGSGYEALRVEEVVKRAEVAKGTFFAHFPDKDTLMEQLIGAELAQLLDQIEQAPTPTSVTGLISALAPLTDFMTSERYVFDVILRYSGAAAIEQIGPIAEAIHRLTKILAIWMAQGGFRKDAAPDTLAEGIVAFLLHCLALNYCALSSATSLPSRLTPLLTVWLTSKQA